MADIENILNNDEFFGDTVDTPKDSIGQHKKRKCLRSAISNDKTYLLGGKWTHEKVDKASNKTISKTYTEYRQGKLNEKGENTGKALGKHVINLYSTRISSLLKIKDVKKLWQDIEDDLIIKDQMTSLGCLFVCTFDNFLAAVLIAVHTVNNLDLGYELEMRVMKVT